MPEAGQAPEPPVVPVTQKFYRLDSRRITFREFCFGGNVVAASFAYLLKVLRVRFASSTDDPPVHDLAAFRTQWDGIAPDHQGRIAPLIERFRALGFEPYQCHFIDDPLHLTKTALVSLACPARNVWARIHLREWKVRVPAKVSLFVELFSSFADGTSQWSLSAKRDMLEPHNIRLGNHVGCEASALWQKHQESVSAYPSPPLASAEGEPDPWETLHARVRAFQVARGVFAPLSPDDEAALARSLRGSDGSASSRHPEVMIELDRLQRKSTNLADMLTLLIVTALFFVGSGKASDWSAEMLLLTVPILLFHELGHFLAMKGFGYRNVRMFFIPFLGAAVTGQNYNLPGWKKVVVSLAGPVPGVILGILLGSVGLALTQPVLVKLGLFALLINGMNLLPVLPMDGGWVVRSTLFCRTPWLDAGFRLFAVAALFLLSAKLDAKIFLWLSIFMAMGIPATYKQGRIVAALQKSGFDFRSADGQTIPVPVADVIVDRLREAFPNRQLTKLLAQRTLMIFGDLNATPPGWLASLTFLGTQLGCLLLSAAFFVVMMLGPQGMSEVQARLRGGAAVEVSHRLDPSGLSAPSQPAGSDAAAPAAVVATFASGAAAKTALAELQGDLGPGMQATLFGESVIVSFPANDTAIRKQYFDRLHGKSKDVTAHSPAMPASLRVKCLAQDLAAAQSMEDEVAAYTSPNRSGNLIPPWSKLDDRNEKERSQHELARRTFLAASRQATKVGTTAFPAEEIGEARRRGDMVEVRRLFDEHRRTRQEALKKAYQSMRADPRWDAQVMDYYLSTLVPRKDSVEQFRALAANMGTIPTAEGKPSARINETARFGFVQRSERSLDFIQFHFIDILVGPALFVRWLESRGCSDFHYDFDTSLGTGQEDEDDDDDEDEPEGTIAPGPKLDAGH
jgi:Zn-dependent protease